MQCMKLPKSGNIGALGNQPGQPNHFYCSLHRVIAMISMVTIFVLLFSLAICNSSWLPHISIATSLPKIGVQSKLDGNTSKAIDVSLYSRQLLVYGESAQHRIHNAHVAVLGSGLLATEVTKTLALAGVGRLSVMQTAPPKAEEVSIRRNQTLYEYAKALNNNIMV